MLRPPARHEDHGFWQIAPAGRRRAHLATRRWYRPDTLVLETEFDTADRHGADHRLHARPRRAPPPGALGRGRQRSRSTCAWTWPCASTTARSCPGSPRNDGLIRLTAGPDSVALWHRVEPRARTCTPWPTSPSPRGSAIPSPSSGTRRTRSRRRRSTATTRSTSPRPTGREWASQCCYDGPYRDAVVRSLITLKALTYEPTGGIVAAATTSLPEAIGGNRNWDYRYCWLRDATLTLESLMRGGYFAEAMAWRDWLLRAVAGDVSKLQIMYGPAGERRLDEWEASLACPATRARSRSGSATPPRSSSSSTSTARSCRRSIHVGHDRGRAQPGRLGPADPAGRFPREGLARARRRHLGGARATPALHALQGDGLGRGRPGRADARGVARARGSARAVARRCATTSSPRSARRATTRTSVPSRSTTAPTSSTPACS